MQSKLRPCSLQPISQDPGQKLNCSPISDPALATPSNPYLGMATTSSSSAMMTSSWLSRHPSIIFFTLLKHGNHKRHRTQGSSQSGSGKDLPHLLSDPGNYSRTHTKAFHKAWRIAPFSALRCLCLGPLQIPPTVLCCPNQRPGSLGLGLLQL